MEAWKHVEEAVSRPQVTPPLPVAQICSCLRPLSHPQERQWQLCPPVSKILERGWSEGRHPAQPVATPPAAWWLPVPSQSASLRPDVLLAMSGPCSEVSARHRPSQPATGSPCWPMALGERVAPSMLAGWDWPWWDWIGRGGRWWRSAGVSPGIDEVLRKADVCRGSCDGNLALR